MILATRKERNILLKSGFTGKQIEALYVVLNSITVSEGTATKPATLFSNTPPATAGVQAAPAIKVMA